MPGDTCMLYIDNRKIKFEARTYLKLVLGALFSIYCYLSILPKHGDFYSLNSIAQLVANGHFNFYEIFTEGNPGNIGGMHPPLFYIIYGIWMKLGSLLDIYNLDSMPIVNGQYLNQSTQFWCMIPYLLILLACTIITYKAFNNKWLSTIWFGSFTFICVIVMGQTDIFAAFFILISIVATIKSFNSDNYVLYLYLGLASLGISTLIKTYGYLLLPIYILVALTLINQNAKDKYLKAKIYS